MAKLIACAGQGVELSGVPTEIKILPLGRVHSQKGDFNVDDESFELIRKQFKDRKLDLVIDYEHQTLSDVQAPAGGWIKDLYKGEDAIIAKVEWTPKAAEYLKNKEYRYLSPVVLVRKRDQKATAIHSVALTNTPAIDGMEISYDDEQESEPIYGRGGKIRGYGTGNQKNSVKLSLLREDFNEMCRVIQSKGYKNFYKYVIPKIVVNYADEGASTCTDVLTNIVLSKRSFKAAQGDKSMKVDLDGIAMGGIKINGLDA